MPTVEAANGQFENNLRICPLSHFVTRSAASLAHLLTLPPASTARYKTQLSLPVYFCAPFFVYAPSTHLVPLVDLVAPTATAMKLTSLFAVAAVVAGSRAQTFQINTP